MSHHPDRFETSARMHLSYAPFGTLNVVGLNRKGPASKPGLSRRSQVGSIRISSGLQWVLKKASPSSFGLAWGFSPMNRANELRGLQPRAFFSPPSPDNPDQSGSGGGHSPDPRHLYGQL